MKKSALFIFIVGLLSINGFGQVTSTGCTINPLKHSSAIGYQTEASGYYSLASGYKVKALADYSYIFGSVPTGITSSISDIKENNTPKSFMIVFEGKPVFFARFAPKTSKDGNEDSDDDPESGEGKDSLPSPTPGGTPAVGIGTIDPQETLDVRGNIIADTVKIKRSIFFPDDELSFTYTDMTWGAPEINTMMTLKRVGTNNRVGIGTKDPQSALHVNGTARFEGHVYLPPNKSIIMGSSIIDVGNRLRIGEGTAAGYQFIDYYPTLHFRTGATNSGTITMTLLSNGKVGIGTTKPDYKLDVNGDARSNNVHTNNIYFHGTEMKIVKMTDDIIMPPDKGTEEEEIEDGEGEEEPKGDRPGQTKTIVTIKENGSVGIGTTSTYGYKLAVKGVIGAEKVKLENTNGWADYVFEPDYNLMSISELETFINENKHLPNIPNKEEVYKNGQDIGEINRLLLEKIEELTLYIIQQDAKMTDMQIQIDALKK